MYGRINSGVIRKFKKDRFCSGTKKKVNNSLMVYQDSLKL